MNLMIKLHGHVIITGDSVILLRCGFVARANRLIILLTWPCSSSEFRSQTSSESHMIQQYESLNSRIFIGSMGKIVFFFLLFPLELYINIHMKHQLPPRFLSINTYLLDHSIQSNERHLLLSNDLFYFIPVPFFYLMFLPDPFMQKIQLLTIKYKLFRIISFWSRASMDS